MKKIIYLLIFVIIFPLSAKNSTNKLKKILVKDLTIKEDGGINKKKLKENYNSLIYKVLYNNLDNNLMLCTYTFSWSHVKQYVGIIKNDTLISANFKNFEVDSLLIFNNLKCEQISDSLKLDFVNIFKQINEHNRSNSGYSSPIFYLEPKK